MKMHLKLELKSFKSWEYIEIGHVKDAKLIEFMLEGINERLFETESVILWCRDTYSVTNNLAKRSQIVHVLN